MIFSIPKIKVRPITIISIQCIWYQYNVYGGHARVERRETLGIQYI